MAIKSITADVVRSNYDGSIKSLDDAANQLRELAVACIKSAKLEAAGIMLYGMVNAIKEIQENMETAKSDMQSVVNGGTTKSISGKRFMNSKFDKLDGSSRRLVTQTEKIVRLRIQQENALRRVKA